MKRSWVLWLLIASSCTSSNNRGDFLTIGSITEGGDIDPITSYTGTVSIIIGAMFDGLVKNDDNFGFRPALAERWWVSPDGKTWRFFLRKGVRFHDGQELTSEDVAFTMRKIRGLGSNGSLAFTFDKVDSIEEEGRYTVVVHLKEPNFQFIRFSDFSIVPKHSYGTPTFKEWPVGTGPFILIRRNSHEVLLKANGNYFLGRPHLDGIRVRIFRTQLEAWSHLMAGDIDTFFPIPPRTYSFLASLPGMKLHSSLQAYYFLLGFNMRDPILRDKNVRAALNLAVDRDALVRDVLLGEGKACYGPLFPGTIGYEEGPPPFPYDPKRAVDILRQSGWIPDKDGILKKGGITLEFTCVTVDGFETLRETGLVLQEQLSRIGVKMNFRTVPLRRLFSLVERKDFQFFLVFSAALFDPDIHSMFFHSSQSGRGLNWFSYRNPVVDELLDKGRMESDPEKRQRVYSLFQKELQRDPPGVFLYWMKIAAGINKRFRGVRFGPCGLYWNLEEWWVPRREHKNLSFDDLPPIPEVEFQDSSRDSNFNAPSGSSRSEKRKESAGAPPRTGATGGAGTY